MAHSSILGIDLGGTKIKAARYSATDWEIEKEKKMETLAQEGFEKVYERLTELIHELLIPEVTGIGVGVPGLIQFDGGIFKLPNIPGAEGFPLQKKLAEKFQLPVVVTNDANCFTLGEALQGAGKDHTVVVGITLGTGVGGGLVINGKPFRGAYGFGVEVGHMLLKPGEVPYTSVDKRGDIEQFISGTALKKRFPAFENPSDLFTEEAHKKLLSDVLREIAWMCVSVTHLIDPAIIVFGGGVGLALKNHLRSIAQEMSLWMLPGNPLPKFACAEREDAATLGAALFTQSDLDS